MTLACGNSGNQDNDFAVIHLVSDVTFSNTIMPVCLPSTGTNYDSRVATTAGWGTFQAGGSTTPKIPYEVDVDTMTNTACGGSNFLYQPSDLSSNMICAGRDGKDACQGWQISALLCLTNCFYLGDSGGPLMTNEGKFFSVIGVVSWGRGCAQKDAPGVYSRVTNQLGWIQGLVTGNTCPKP